MTSPLTDEQRELLSAFADEEVTDAERQTAEKLLEREDARDYLASLRATAQLVVKHASVSAPVGLSGRVMSELQKDLKPKAGKLHTLPSISWQTPLWAAAAVVVVSLSIMFGPSLISPKPTPDASVARGVLDNLPADHAGDSLSATPPETEKPSGDALFATNDDSNEDREIGGGSGGRVLERMSRDRASDATNETTEEAARLKGSSDKLSGKLSKEDLDEYRGAQSPKDGSGSSDAGDAPKSGRSDDWGPAESNEKDGKNGLRDELDQAEKQAEKRDQEEGERKRESDPRPPAPPPAVPAPPPVTPAKEPVAQPNNGEKHEADPDDAARRDELDNELTKKKDENADPRTEGKSNLAEDEEPAEDGAKVGKVRRLSGEPEQSKAEAATEPVEIDIAGAGSLKGQTDILWVSSLYGDAGLSDDDSDIENISVEIDRARLPELLSALRKLAKDQGYGAVDGEDAAPDAEADGQGHRISGYLPADAPDTKTGPTTDAEPERVTVVIRLK